MAKSMSDELNSFIDHTLLRPDATQDQVRTVCEETIKCKQLSPKGESFIVF